MTTKTPNLDATFEDEDDADDVVDSMRDNFGHQQGGQTAATVDGGYWADNIFFANNYDSKTYPPTTTARRSFLNKLVKSAEKYNYSFVGNDDGTWEKRQGYVLSFKKQGYDWLISPSLSNQNNWKTLDVDGATEYNVGFIKALNDIVKNNPEISDFIIGFDGPYKKVSDVIQLNQLKFEDIVFYHGTSKLAWNKIKNEGLKPRSETKVDPAYGAGYSVGPGNQALIYLTTQQNMAKFAANDAARAHKSDPIILKITGLDEQFAVPDEDSEEDTAIKSLYRLGSIGYTKTITPDKIIEAIEKESNHLSDLRKLAKDLRVHGLDDVCDNVVLAIFAETNAMDARPDLSYSFIMRQLRKLDPDRAREFQEHFKKAFDEAFLTGIDNVDDAALMQTIQEIELKPEELSSIEEPKAIATNREYRLYKLAQNSLGGDITITGRHVADIVKFLLRKISYVNRYHSMLKLREKIWNLDEYDMASKKSPPTASLGQSITFIKTLLNGKDPGYIRGVLSEIVRNLV